MSGPYIVLLDSDSAQHTWRASVMIVTPPPQGAVLPSEPALTLQDQGAHHYPLQYLQMSDAVARCCQSGRLVM